MKIARKNRPLGDIDVTSFSDLAFLLIIFFVLTTSFVRPMGARTTIPSSTSDPKAKSEEQMPTINLSRNSLIFNETEMSLDELRRRLAALKLADREEAKRFVVLECAADVPFERYFPVVTAISRAGGILTLIETVEQEGKP